MVRDFALLLIENVEPGVGDRSAYGDRIARRCYVADGRPDCGLCGTVQVPQFAFRHEIGRKRVAQRFAGAE